MKKSINPKAIEIQRRFFTALELVIASKQLKGLKTFCENHDLNRTKYSRIKMNWISHLKRQNTK